MQSTIAERTLSTRIEALPDFAQDMDYADLEQRIVDQLNQGNAVTLDVSQVVTAKGVELVRMIDRLLSYEQFKVEPGASDIMNHIRLKIFTFKPDLYADSQVSSAIENVSHHLKALEEMSVEELKKAQENAGKAE